MSFEIKKLGNNYCIDIPKGKEKEVSDYLHQQLLSIDKMMYYDDDYGCIFGEETYFGSAIVITTDLEAVKFKNWVFMLDVDDTDISHFVSMYSAFSNDEMISIIDFIDNIE